MIQEKLLLIEYAVVKNPHIYKWSLNTVRKIRDLIAQIDFNAEVVPVESATSLQHLLTSLKGDSLSEDESELVVELVTI